MSEIDLKKIAEELGIDKPIVTTRMVGNRVEVYLYDGQVLFWPESPAPSKKSERPGSGETHAVTGDALIDEEPDKVTPPSVPPKRGEGKPAKKAKAIRVAKK